MILDNALSELMEYSIKYPHLEEFFMSTYCSLHTANETIKELENAERKD